MFVATRLSPFYSADSTSDNSGLREPRHRFPKKPRALDPGTLLTQRAHHRLVWSSSSAVSVITGAHAQTGLGESAVKLPHTFSRNVMVAILVYTRSPRPNSWDSRPPVHGSDMRAALDGSGLFQPGPVIPLMRACDNYEPRLLGCRVSVDIRPLSSRGTRSTRLP